MNVKTVTIPLEEFAALRAAARERDDLRAQNRRQRKAILELSTELVEVAQRSPQALTLLQLEAVATERDALAARLAAVEALADKWRNDEMPDPTSAWEDLRAALATGTEAEE